MIVHYPIIRSVLITMGQIYTRKKDDYDKDEKTINASEFIERMLSNQRIPDKHRKEDYIESTK